MIKKEKGYLNCSECPRCRPQPGLKNGVKETLGKAIGEKHDN